MKKAELTFAALSVPIDYLMLVLAAVSAYWLRYAGWIQNIRPVIFDLDFDHYLEVTLPIAAVWLVIFALAGLYTITFHQRLIDELGKIVYACSTGLMLIIIYIFWQREFFDSRFIILAAYGLAVLYVSIARMLLRYIRRLLLLKNWGVTKVILIGNEKLTDDLAAVFYRKPVFGYRIVERLEEFNSERILAIANQTSVDEVILADTNVSKEIRSQLLNFCYSHHFEFRYVADMFDAQSHNVEIQSISGLPIVAIKKTPLDGWGRIAKRGFDMIIGVLLFVLLIPLAVVIILIIKIDSHGPAFVKLSRVGRNGNIFKMIKFRSMIKDAHKLKYDDSGNLRKEMALMNQRSDGPLFKLDDDPRVTRFGRWLRRSSLDELPQLINVLKGDMSLVGPRPHEPEEVKKYEAQHQKLLSIKPGMTGLGQISGRANLTFEDEVKLDFYYIENWSLKNDIQILFKTIWAVLGKRGVA